MIESGEKNRTEANILDPKNVQTILPEVEPNVKERNEVTAAVASASVADLCIIPNDFESIQPRVD